MEKLIFIGLYILFILTMIINAFGILAMWCQLCAEIYLLIKHGNNVK